MHPSKTASARRTAFTLAELLVVIGIIALLMAILFPVINKVKAQGWRADSMNQINVLRSAIDAYQLTFNAYPGPVSNDDIVTPKSIAGVTGDLTMSENLFLGVGGGLRLQGTTPTFVPGSAGQGPASLNPRNPKVYNPFMENAVKQSSKGKYAEAEGATTADDTNVPEFVDRFPQNPLPVLYYRAKTGAPGLQQYSAKQNTAYTTASNGRIGPVPEQKDASGNFVAIQHGLHVDSEGAANDPLKPFPITGLRAAPDRRGNALFPYLMDRSLGMPYTPRAKDTYVLISAGPDRIYGTNDDLTSFGSVTVE